MRDLTIIQLFVAYVLMAMHFAAAFVSNTARAMPSRATFVSKTSLNWVMPSLPALEFNTGASSGQPLWYQSLDGKMLLPVYDDEDYFFTSSLDEWPAEDEAIDGGAAVAPKEKKKGPLRVVAAKALGVIPRLLSF